MRRIIYLFLIIAGVGLLATPVSNLTIDEKIWFRIDSLESVGLYRSALSLTEQVYAEARSRADQETEIKALIYKLKFVQELEEDGPEAAIRMLESVMPDERLVPGSLKHSMLAELYHRYFIANRWQVSQNPMEAADSAQALKKWPPEQFYNKILEQYGLSMEKRELLAGVRTGSLQRIWTGNLADTLNKPSLYDILVSRALDFIESAGDFSLPALKPSIYCSPVLFADPENFVKAASAIRNTGSDPFEKALTWYGAWLQKVEPTALLQTDLRRLNYVHDQSCHASRDSLYESALLRWEGKLGRDSAIATVYEALAMYHLDRAGLYRINGTDTLKFRMERKKAAAWLEKSKSWSSTLAGKRCKNLFNSLIKPELTVFSEAYQVPALTFPVSIEYRNLGSLNYRIFRMNALTYYSEWNELEPVEKLRRLTEWQPVRSGNIVLPDDGDLNPHRTNALLDPLPAGFYLIAFSTREKVMTTEDLLATVTLAMTRINLVTPHSGDSDRRVFYFRNSENGSPLAGLQVTPWYSLYDQETRKPVLEKGKRRLSRAEGFLEIPDGGPGRDDPSPKAYRLEIIQKLDTLVTREVFYPGNKAGEQQSRTNLLLFTDRSLYKPGEVVWFRGLMIDYHGDSMAIHRTDSVRLTLQDPRYQVIGQFNIPVDTLGVFSGSIRLPFKGLTGSYILQSRFGQTSIRMEQYKRPAFSIQMLPDSRIFQPGDTMQVAGKITALSGEPVPAAEILADVDLEPGYGPRKWAPFAGQKIRVATVKTKSGSDGSFICKWMAIPEGSSPFGSQALMQYTINIRATDLNGETHQEETRLDCGKGSVRILLDMEKNFLATDSLKGEIKAYSTDGRTVKLPFLLRVSKLKDPNRTWAEPAFGEPDRFVHTRGDWQKRMARLPYRNEHLPSSWEPAGVEFTKEYLNDTVTRILIPPAGRWRNGWYKVEVIPKDTLTSVAQVRYIHVEDPEPRKIEAGIPLYTRISRSSAKTGEFLEFRYASEDRGFILVDIRNGKGNPLTAWYPVDNRVRKLTWKVTGDWQGGAAVQVVMLHSNRIYQENHRVSVPWENSELKITGLENLKLVSPGDSLEINLLVRDEKGIPVRASVGISVYDASLDQIAPHEWVKVRRPGFNGSLPFMALNSGSNASFILFEPPVDYVDAPGIEPVMLNWFGMGYYGINRMDAPVMKMAMTRQEGRPASVGDARGSEGSEGAEGGEGDQGVKIGENLDKKEYGNPQMIIRKDFSETAVFRGNLLTDERGVASVRFKVPDAFTEWKVMVSGHDRTLAFGDAVSRFRSARDLMLKSNFPEFMRKGDTVDLSARLGWYGKGRLTAFTSLALSDSSGRVVRDFPPVKSELSSGDVAPFTWRFVANKSEAVSYRIGSVAGGSSDGLSDTLKVYPDDVELWNAQPFFLPKPGKKLLNIDGDPLEAVFEVTTTPAWQVLQSLPVVNKQERDCSEYWFSRLYLACLAGSIADRFPGVAERFLRDSLEIKDKDRFRQVREWMDPAGRGIEMAYVLEKLSDLQNQDGTWPWFKGMGTDLFMTQQIIAGFGELKTWGVFDISSYQRGNYMLTHAIEAMDKWMYRQFREVIRLDSVHPVKIQLNPLVINYLYSRSYFPGLTLSPENEIAWIHFNERIPLEWTGQEPGLQALMAITCNHLGRMDNSLPIFKSLRERARIDEQWGMYWPRKGMSSSWFNWDLWMQSRMVELFAGMEEGVVDVDRIKLYLIHQKRGRDWGNGMVAAWAAKSILFFGTGATLKPASVEMRWGDANYSPLRIQTGSTGASGYYRFAWKNPGEMPESRTMEVTHQGGGPAWGTLFTLENHKIDELSATGGPLNIKRDLMVRDAKGTWITIPKGSGIRIGEVVRVRLNIKSDRELSYIEITDYLGTGFMPVQLLSGFQYRSGLSSYQSRGPETVIFNVSQLPKGSSIIEYLAVAEQAGNYSGGYATAISLYAPEFRAWSNSVRIRASR